mgnify:CR=1 FL=1
MEQVTVTNYFLKVTVTKFVITVISYFCVRAHIFILQHVESELVSVDAHDSSIQAASDDDFFCFGVDTREQSDATVEVDLYLSDSSREIECLN